jgi:flagellum-specific ATP synthase
MTDSLDMLKERLEGVNPIKVSGRVEKVVGLTIESRGPATAVGEVCRIETSGKEVVAEVVGFRDDRVILMPVGEARGIAPGDRVVATDGGFKVPAGDALLGRVIDARGRPLDGLGPIVTATEVHTEREAPSATQRERISEVLPTGIRAIDAALTLGAGQRIGIFSGSGVGKSTLLGMIARYSSAEVNVIGLVGERGREVRDFIERDLGPEGLSRSVVVVATSDEPPMLRLKGAFTATAVAEYFRDQGKKVVLMMDSVTRLAMAQREIGLAVGEPPATKGYPPSVFSMLPRLLERSGTTEHRGSITGFYTVLVESDDMNEPIADSVRAILDGHVVLSRQLAERGHFPAVDVSASVSRLMLDVATPEHMAKARLLRRMLADYASAEDLINIGAYVAGSNPAIDEAIGNISGINTFLQQDVGESVAFKETVSLLSGLFKAAPAAAAPGAEPVTAKAL